jgi:hypothetical protein
MHEANNLMMTTSEPQPRRNEPRTSKQDSSDSGDDLLAKLKTKYSRQLAQIQPCVPDWNMQDLVYVLDETQGDAELALNRILEGLSRPNMLIIIRSCHSMAQGVEQGRKTRGS